MNESTVKAFMLPFHFHYKKAPRGSSRNKRGYIKKFQEALREQIKHTDAPLIGFGQFCKITVEFLFQEPPHSKSPKRTGRDIDNLQKTFLDAIQRKGRILADDQTVIEIHATKKYDQPSSSVGTNFTVELIHKRDVS